MKLSKLFPTHELTIKVSSDVELSVYIKPLNTKDFSKFALRIAEATRELGNGNIKDDSMTPFYNVACEFLTEAIETWDIEDDSGKPLPVNPDTLRLLPQNLFMTLMNRVQAYYNAPLAS